MSEPEQIWQVVPQRVDDYALRVAALMMPIFPLRPYVFNDRDVYISFTAREGDLKACHRFYLLMSGHTQLLNRYRFFRIAQVDDLGICLGNYRFVLRFRTLSDAIYCRLAL